MWGLQGKWVNENAEITKGLLALNVGGALFLGGLLSWILFGEPWQLACKIDWEASGAWAAALGTWIVGVMAWRIASQAHEHHRNTTRLQAERDAKREHAVVVGFRESLRTCRAVAESLAEDKKYKNFYSLNNLHGTALAVLNSLRWSEEIHVHLKKDMRTDYENFRMQQAGTINGLQDSLNVISKFAMTDDLNEAGKQQMKEVQELATTLVSDCTKLLERIAPVEAKLAKSFPGDQ